MYAAERSAAGHGGGTLRHDALNFLDLSGELRLLASLLIDPVSYIVELFAAAWVRRFARRLDLLARAILLRVALPDIRLLLCVFPGGQLARREDALADVLRVVVDSLVHELRVGHQL